MFSAFYSDAALTTHGEQEAQSWAGRTPVVDMVLVSPFLIFRNSPEQESSPDAPILISPC